jgi:hypothetical protein
MIPMENFGHRRKTTEQFRLSDHKNGGILKAQNGTGALPKLIQRVNKKSKANFVKRLLDPNRKSIQD